MKNIKLFSLLLILFTAVISCTELEEEPIGLLAPEAMFKTPTDVETAVLGCYGRIASESYYGRKLTLALQLRSDMCDIGDRGTPSRRQNINDFTADPNNGMLTAFWPRSYEIISAANAALDGADRVEGDENELNALRGEARFVRGFVYYHLVRLFGEIPYIDFFVSDPAAIVDISKTPVSEIYQKIIEDFTFAKNNLPDMQPDGTRFRPTAATAAAYLASVALTRNDYSVAASEAKWVIDNQSRFDLELIPDYQNLFDATKTNGCKEFLFAVDFAAGLQGGGNEGTDWMAPITGIRGSDDQGWSVSVPSIAVYESWSDKDYRKSVAFDDTTLVEGVPTPYTEFQRVQRPHLAKYMRLYGNSRGDGGQSDNNYIAMRYAEVLLIAAEAENQLNGPANSMQYINEIRARARNAGGDPNDFPPDVEAGISQQDLHDLIIEERRLELSFEFKRWYDIKRLDIGTEVFKGPDSLEPHENFDPDKHYLLPIPQKEIDINSNLLPQNPGY